MEFVFDRADITPDFVQRFHEALSDAGLRFPDSIQIDGASCEALIADNQRWLAADHDPETETHDSDYRLMLRPDAYEPLYQI